MKGKLIVIEGSDASGKSTQCALVLARLKADNIHVKHIAFPRYDSDSSALVRQYLSGTFGSKPGDVNAYAASTFFAVDRFASYRTEWGADLENGTHILLDRYTTSNAVHQASKLPPDEQIAFFDWLYHFEFNLMGLPKPDKVFFLDMPTKFALALLENRVGKDGDIHEFDAEYLKKCYNTALSAAQHLGWDTIPCTANEELKSISDINTILYEKVKKELYAKF